MKFDFSNLALKPAGKVFFTFVLILIVYAIYFMVTTLDAEQDTVEIELSNCPKNIYIKQYAWGVNGNATEITISNEDTDKRGQEYMSDTYFLSVGERLFYKIDGDSLLTVITESRPKQPSNFVCNECIFFIPVSISDLYSNARQYEQQGFTLFPKE